MSTDIVRRVRLSPYRKGAGPTFTLTLSATNRTDWRGQTILAYRLSEGRRIIFEGDDFTGSPLDTDDSDETIAALMTFLTLRPGDTDAEYFSSYTDAQREFASEHAEILSWYCATRFEEVRP